jgi:hypothetical protein
MQRPIVTINDPNLAAIFFTWAASQGVPRAKERILEIVDEGCPIEKSCVGEIDGMLEGGQDSDYNWICEVVAESLSNL